ncbi:MAG: glycosyltransferase family 2 protein [Bacteroidales bacterium]|nr:glycosyltransferase family 2 protein [Bacteroidales bacterium]
MNKKISVIIPIYNSEKYVKQTLNFVRFQSYKNLEIICVLDCPTDNSVEIVKEIAKEDNRIKLVEHSKNMGLAVARNSGIENATGEFLHFMDSDDLLSCNFYEIMINAAIENDADVSACSVFNEKKPKQSIWFAKDEVIFGREKIKKTEVLFRGWIWRYLIKRDFWDKHSFSFPNLVIMEDLPVAIPMIYHANKIAVCSDAVYFYKNRENSLLNENENTDFSKEQKKIRKKNVSKAKKAMKDVMKTYSIKRPNKWLWLKERILGKFICVNNFVEHGKSDKKISIIIPIYNAEKYLKQTLDSVRYQTYENLEIVCVLDCPTDSSAKIVKEAAKEDNRIKIIELSKNMGLPAARNSGVENAMGEFLHFMDSDDLISPDFYEIMIGSAENSDVDIAACSVLYEKKPWRSIWFQKSEILSNTDDKIKKTEVAVQGWAWRYLIKKDFWDEYQFSFPDLVPMEDKPVMIPMIYYANSVALCPSAVYFYKNRESSILNKKYDPVREKQRSENRQKARKIFKDFMRENKIKRPSKLLYYVKKIRIK